MSTSKQRDRGLVILSLDGGGVRGLSSLLILKECMKRLQGQLGLPKRPEVYEHFDMVGGTGTGGISAAMLGRLRIPLDCAIEHFAQIATDVFSERKSLSTGGSGNFKSTKMQQALKNMIRETTGDENEMLLDDRSEGDICKTVIFAMSKHNLNGGLPRAFRSYQASVNQMPDCTIWEALCATTAHPDLFKSIDIGDGLVKESFVDGGLGCSNPLAHILSEVKLMYPDRHIGCVISIGAGHARTIHIPSFNPFQRLFPTNVIKTMKEIAMNSEQEAQRMAIRFSHAHDIYFRLNVDQGMQRVELSDWERLSEVTAHTTGYMQRAEVIEMVEKLVTALNKKEGVIAAAHIDGQLPVAIDRMRSIGIKAYPLPTSIFVGREGPVQRAAKYLLSGGPQRKIYVIHGLGGSGKTQMALRVVEQTQEYWSDIVFADATSITTIEATFKDFAMRKSIGDTHEATLRWLASTTARWLLVIDNADDPTVNVINYLPGGPSGRILVTTRNQGLRSLAIGSDSDYNASVMEPGEALQLLLKTSRRENEELGEGEIDAAKQLLEDFGCLPLAITQAGGYIQNTQCTFGQYRELYLKQPGTMMQEHDPVRMQLDKYERTTFDAWVLSYDLLSNLARRLLWMLCYMKRDRITVDIFRRAAINVQGFAPIIPPSELEQDAYQHVKSLLSSFLDSSGDWDLSRFLGVMREILSYSLIEYDRVNMTYVLHPLVQTWARTVAPDRVGGMHPAYLLASALNWHEGSEDYILLRSLHLHTTSTLQHFRASSDTLMACLANVLYRNGQYAPAAQLQSQVVQLRLQVLGGQHTLTLRAMAQLAAVYCDQGRWKEAEELEVQVLDARKQVLGKNHPDTIMAMNNLATTYSKQGRWTEAEALEVQVFEAQEQMLGNNHPATLTAMNNLAIIYADQGHEKEAERLRVQVLDGRKRVLGENHPDTLMAMANLAVTYSNQSRHKEAEELRVRVLNARKQVLGEDHPDTLSAMRNLSVTYCEQGHHREAEELQLQVLDARRRVLGQDHPDTLRSMHDLAITYANQGCRREAEVLQVQVLNASKRVLGEDHPDTLMAMGNLAITYYKSGNLEQAAELKTHVLDRRWQLLGTQHPHTVQAMHNLAITYKCLGRPYRAKLKALSKELLRIEASTDFRDSTAATSLLSCLLPPWFSKPNNNLEEGVLLQTCQPFDQKCLRDTHNCLN